MVKIGESEREAAARSDELFEDGDIVAAGGKNHSEIRIKQKNRGCLWYLSCPRSRF